MPLGWERINARTSQPNKNIVFIKPLLGPDSNTAKDFLERIAAQCLPIMNKHHLAVTSLEEYEPNFEFWGRNFNGGEVIQLVLKSPSTGRWLPFSFVQLVMMHELAHNKQMNHSKAFWAVRNEFTAEMKLLWEKDYTGEGLWGKGVLLENGAFARKELDAAEVFPQHMCGGTFRSKGNKRKAKPKITYKERQERRIQKKFGINGVALGADDKTKAKLEKGKRVAGKPRVAGSVRGRELRAAAALARFEVKKEEPQDGDLVTDSEAEESDDEPTIKPEPDDALDINGSRLLDRKGGGMVRVCGEENNDDDDVKRELLDLQSVRETDKKATYNNPRPALTNSTGTSSNIEPRRTDNTPAPSTSFIEHLPEKRAILSQTGKTPEKASENLAQRKPAESSASLPDTAPKRGTCRVCSVENEPSALTCMVCLNVLQPDYVPNIWRCDASTCKDGVYLNSGDVSFCGACGARKCS